MNGARRARAAPALRVVVADAAAVVRAGLAALLGQAEGVEVVAEAADGAAAREAVTSHRPDLVLLDPRLPGAEGPAALPELAVLAPVLALSFSAGRAAVEEAIQRGAGGYLVHGEFTPGQLLDAVRDVAAGRAAFSAGAATVLLARMRADRTAAGPGGSTGAAGATGTAAAPIPLQSQSSPSQLQSDVGQSRRAADRTRFGLSPREEEVMELIAGGMTNQQIAAACFISEKTVKNHINRIFGKLRADSRSKAIALWLGTWSPRGEG
ncbi:response regulator transcription factor [Streptomyces sp. ICBB 8177]|uniref:LuxR C-terminal-related transcriptional regulator n=1 Tax=Streptomyces sp. ICBB 8177 TaxID=563922 RepID=UPI000D677E78|nr:response regulator transcription factor [Streptomyces sp. ICBB 8177]PWI43865.1 DNA-binding response regulator [Streptomyces sp. ICBB 8177]